MVLNHLTAILRDTRTASAVDPAPVGTGHGEGQAPVAAVDPAREGGAARGGLGSVEERCASPFWRC